MHCWPPRCAASPPTLTRNLNVFFGYVAESSSKLAAVTTDKVVYLFDENGERKDKFKTKPADSGTSNYVVRAMGFSPDSTKLAIAQSDNIVFVYR